MRYMVALLLVVLFSGCAATLGAHPSPGQARRSPADHELSVKTSFLDYFVTEIVRGDGRAADPFAFENVEYLEALSPEAAVLYNEALWWDWAPHLALLFTLPACGVLGAAAGAAVGLMLLAIFALPPGAILFGSATFLFILALGQLPLGAKWPLRLLVVEPKIKQAVEIYNEALYDASPRRTRRVVGRMAY